MTLARKIGLGCGGLILVNILIGVCTIIGICLFLRLSDAYRLATEAAAHDPSVTAELGAPLRTGWLPMGKVTSTGPVGEANLAIPLSGPRGEGTLNACATKSAGQWTLTCLKLEISGRPALELLPSTP